MTNYEEFFQSSPIARTISPESCVVLKRGQMSTRELLRIKESGEYRAGSLDIKSCELEIGGRTIAVGKIIRRKGKYFFKISHFDTEHGFAIGETI